MCVRSPLNSLKNNTTMLLFVSATDSATFPLMSVVAVHVVVDDSMAPSTVFLPEYNPNKNSNNNNNNDDNDFFGKTLHGTSHQSNYLSIAKNTPFLLTIILAFVFIVIVFLAITTILFCMAKKRSSSIRDGERMKSNLRENDVAQMNSDDSLGRGLLKQNNNMENSNNSNNKNNIITNNKITSSCKAKRYGSADTSLIIVVSINIVNDVIFSKKNE
ncbi:hypothetical protein HELRODRAFT_182273 [Helobdella robusta]|uniref:Uncharacterized protein n=1 Tax=Helobdella robusta TaxID=6412 RepID=T1FI07_HELRO|nr:hypothetical protein HELRODRAFT_182273 [Helobdella robusta]ESN91117.1 hypothetical protein HELRODRAFT_182273 [Helobdella robusta]